MDRSLSLSPTTFSKILSATITENSNPVWYTVAVESFFLSFFVV